MKPKSKQKITSSQKNTSKEVVSYNKLQNNFSWKKHQKEISYFKNNKINAAYNAITRHALSNNKHKIAISWENEQGKTKKYSFQDLDQQSNKFANLLKKIKVKKRDRVFIFLPKVPETYISFLGILKTGAIAGTMFQAFGEDALKDRLKDSGCKVLITNSKLSKRIYKIKQQLPKLKHIILIDKLKVKTNEISYRSEMSKASNEYKIKHLKSDDPAFMLYTSGTTGKPKGIIHTHFAILQQHLTAKYVLDLKENDIYWCTADPGWVTGISYGILGNWSNAITTIVYEGRFSPEKWYSIIEKYHVSVWYTAPTAIRMLMKAGSKAIKKSNLASLRHLCSVGEPLNPEAIKWGIKEFKLPFHDTWWQTETGSICISNFPGLKVKPGSMGKPFPGIKAAVVDHKGKKIVGKVGDLVIKPKWPAMMKTVWRNQKKYQSYFKYGWYYSGDKAKVDKDGYFWFVGRADDIITSRGERIGPFELESALIEHPGIVEAGVIGKPDPLYGEIIKAFVVLATGYKVSKNFQQEIKKFVKKKLAGHIYPAEIEIRKSLPKTRSGKIMRRILKAEELGESIGDVSTLEDE